MGLISRKAAIDALNMNGCCGMGITYLLDCDSVPAVPLDKLCVWLAKFGCPCALNGGICDQHGVFHCVGYGKSNVFCWRYLLTKWMEEQDAAD